MAAAQVPRAALPALSGGARGAALLAACGLLAALAGCSRSAARTWPDGSRRSEGRVTLVGGAPTGTWRWFHPNGELRERGTYEDGHRAGVWTQWWSNGQRRSQGLRAWNPGTRTSEREGPWTFWHQNGTVAGRGVYRCGRREGHWEASIDDGSLDGDASGEFHDGERIEGS